MHLNLFNFSFPIQSIWFIPTVTALHSHSSAATRHKFKPALHSIFWILHSHPTIRTLHSLQIHFEKPSFQFDLSSGFQQTLPFKNIFHHQKWPFSASSSKTFKYSTFFIYSRHCSKVLLSLSLRGKNTLKVSKLKKFKGASWNFSVVFEAGRETRHSTPCRTSHPLGCCRKSNLSP